ncbi:MAG TPA: hypothetical protein VGI43_09815 [Mucilaginibacter sp.]|jgi:hypothetical protein
MSVQYLSDEKGQIVAVQVPIKEWELLKSKYPELEVVDTVLPDWQKDLIDARLNSVRNNPERILPIDGLIAELDRIQD